MIKVEIAGNNVSEIKAGLLAMLSAMPVENGVYTAKVVDTQPELPYPTAKAAKKAKAVQEVIDDVAVVTEPVETNMWGTPIDVLGDIAAPAVPESLTLESVKKMVKQVHATKGLNATIKVLATVGLKSANDIKPTHFVKLVEACTAELV